MTAPPDNRERDPSQEGGREWDRESAGSSASLSSGMGLAGWMADTEQMVRDQLAREQPGRPAIRDGRVLRAFRAVNRAQFVVAEHRAEAFADRPLPIGFDQTISQPYMVAAQLEVVGLLGHERVLEIGTGSGYQTALLAHLAREVYSVERISQLLNSAAHILLDVLRLPNVYVRLGDGTLGWPEVAPFDAIVVSAGAPEIPLPLLNQLAIGGRMAIPVQVRDPNFDGQRLTLITRTSESDFHTQSLMPCRFVKLYGHSGWQP